jgi:hypothetical protein
MNRTGGLAKMQKLKRNAHENRPPLRIDADTNVWQKLCHYCQLPNLARLR